MEKDDKGSTLIRLGVSGWKFLLVPAYAGCPGSKAVKRSSALTLLVGWQEGHPACKNWVVGCWCGYQSWARCRLAYGPADALPLTVSCLSKFRLVLPFLYRLTWVVPDKRPLNGCMCVCVYYWCDCVIGSCISVWLGHYILPFLCLPVVCSSRAVIVIIIRKTTFNKGRKYKLVLSAVAYWLKLLSLISASSSYSLSVSQWLS